MTMTDLATIDTDHMLAAMLTENTGTHMLDSGGAYGRAWQRNAGKTIADFIAAPPLTMETWERDGSTRVEYVTLDLFHFLRERLDYDADLDAVFHKFAMEPEREGDSWFACLDEWLDSFRAEWQGSGWSTVNTCNGEDSLSQTIQYAMFEHPETEDPMIALSIHGGCDVRGGYTAPRMFTLDAHQEYAMFDNDRYTAVLTEPDSTPEQMAQAAMFPEYPVPAGGRQVMIDFSSGYGDRNTYPWDDKSLDEIDFTFGETPILPPGEGDTEFIIASGPAKGWRLSMHEWPAG